jgi:signal transduction histidine kinase
MREFMNDKLLEIAIHDPEYFFERMYRDIYPDMMSRSGIIQGRSDVPITLLLILRGKENHAKRLIKELSRRDSRMSKRGYPFTIRIRWWDEQNITSLVQKNLPLARKYFSSEALVHSGVRLSYEELNKQNADMVDELQNTNQLLESERGKIELLERDAAWKLLSFTAAHRLGNPMDAIDSELSNLKKALSMGKTDMIEDIVQSMEIPIENAKSIVSEFRNLSIAQEIKPEEVISEKLNEILKYSAKQAIDKNVKVIFDFKKVPDISIDIQKLSDCFSELVRNSLHFLKEDDQKICISVELSKIVELPEKIDRTKDYVKIVFADNGCGVLYEKKNEIFKPFATSYIHGTGLGLAYCESVIERHGGKVREVGKPNEGAIFEIFLPLTQNIEKTN